MSAPTVTVAILAYYRQYLEECIASVLAQTYRDLRVIVYDDHSPENLKSVYEKFSDPRLEYRRNETNLGEGGNNDKAFADCDTEYISIFHGDDEMFPWMIEYQVAALDAHPYAGAVFTSSHGIGQGAHKPRAIGRLYKKGEIVEEMARRNVNFVISPSVTYRKSIAEPYRKYWQECMLDMHIWIAMNFYGMEMYGYDSPLMFYHQHTGNTTHRFRADEWKQCMKHMYDWAVAHELNDNVLDFMRRYFALIALSTYVRNPADGGIDNVLNYRDTLENDFGWSINNSILGEAVAIGYLGQLITAPTIDRTELHSRAARIKELGIKVPFSRRLKWMLKYRVWI